MGACFNSSETRPVPGQTDRQTMLRKRSCPAVSQSCRRTLRPLTMTFLVTNRAPLVEVVLLGSNWFWMYRHRRDDLPTPALPMTTILASTPRSSAKGSMVDNLPKRLPPLSFKFLSPFRTGSARLNHRPHAAFSSATRHGYYYDY